MPDDIDTRVSPSLHVSVVKGLDGYDESVAHLLGPTETALSEAYIGIGRVHTAREAAKRNPAWNEAQQVLQVHGLAEKVQRKINDQFFSVRASLEKGIEQLERELSAPVTAKASHPVASEIRAHFKNLKTGERMAAIQQAIREGNEPVATAVLGAWADLSGLDAKMQQILTRQWHERVNPDAARRLKVMAAANEMLANRHSIAEAELEKALGVSPAKARALREASTAAEKHFVAQS